VGLPEVQMVERRVRKAMHWLAEVARRAPGLFAHRRFGLRANGWVGAISREVHSGSVRAGRCDPDRATHSDQ